MLMVTRVTINISAICNNHNIRHSKHVSTSTRKLK